VRAGGPYVAITVVCTGPGRVELDPYPLGVSELAVTLPLHELEDRAYPTADDASAAFAAITPRPLRVTVTAAG
jgi:hypothetical protein